MINIFSLIAVILIGILTTIIIVGIYTGEEDMTMGLAAMGIMSFYVYPILMAISFLVMAISFTIFLIGYFINKK